MSAYELGLHDKELGYDWNNPYEVDTDDYNNYNLGYNTDENIYREFVD